MSYFNYELNKYVVEDIPSVAELIYRFGNTIPFIPAGGQRELEIKSMINTIEEKNTANDELLDLMHQNPEHDSDEYEDSLRLAAMIEHYENKYKDHDYVLTIHTDGDVFVKDSPRETYIFKFNEWDVKKIVDKLTWFKHNIKLRNSQESFDTVVKCCDYIIGEIEGSEFLKIGGLRYGGNQYIELDKVYSEDIELFS
ncbi:hypothetical protein N9043_00225 [bacterium]|nr:hypothetical protein [bacterium]